MSSNTGSDASATAASFSKLMLLSFFMLLVAVVAVLTENFVAAIIAVSIGLSLPIMGSDIDDNVKLLLVVTLFAICVLAVLVRLNIIGGIRGLLEYG